MGGRPTAVFECFCFVSVRHMLGVGMWWGTFTFLIRGDRSWPVCILCMRRPSVSGHAGSTLAIRSHVSSHSFTLVAASSCFYPRYTTYKVSRFCAYRIILEQYFPVAWWHFTLGHLVPTQGLVKYLTLFYKGLKNMSARVTFIIQPYKENVLNNVTSRIYLVFILS